MTDDLKQRLRVFAGDPILGGVIDEAADRIEQLESERDELLADAMRYRWLRENPEWIGYDSDFRPDEVDAAINAAIDKTEGQS